MAQLKSCVEKSPKRHHSVVPNGFEDHRTERKASRGGKIVPEAEKRTMTTVTNNVTRMTTSIPVPAVSPSVRRSILPVQDRKNASLGWNSVFRKWQQGKCWEGAETDTNDHPMVGVKLKLLFDILESLGNDIDRLTTAEVCQKIVKPATRADFSYCDYLVSKGWKDMVGKPSLFVSHAWNYLFKDVAVTLRFHLSYRVGDEDALNTIVWFDLFCNCQHESIIKAPRVSSWWRGTFRTAIASMKRTLVVLTPWKRPVALTRAWCLWEIFCSLEGNCNFHFEVAPSEVEDLLATLREKSGVEIVEMLMKIDVRKSESSKKEDTFNILEAVRNSIGFDTINKRIIEYIRQWIISVVTRELGKEKSPEKRLQLMMNLVGLELGEGRSEELELFQIEAARASEKDAKSQAQQIPVSNSADSTTDAPTISKPKSLFSGLFEKIIEPVNMLMNQFATLQNFKKIEKHLNVALKETQQIYGMDHEYTFDVMRYLGYLYFMKNAYANAEDLFRKLIKRQKMRKVVDFVAQNNLATICVLLEKYEEAESIYKFCIEEKTKELGPDEATVLTTMSNLANLYQKMGRFSEAENLYDIVTEKRRCHKGDEDVQTITSYLSLANVCLAQGQLNKAEKIYRKYLDDEKHLLDPFDRNKFAVLNNLAVICQSDGRLAEAEQLLRTCEKNLQKTSLVQICMMAQNNNVQQSTNGIDPMTLVFANLEATLLRQGNRDACGAVRETSLELRKRLMEALESTEKENEGDPKKPQAGGKTSRSRRASDGVLRHPMFRPAKLQKTVSFRTGGSFNSGGKLRLTSKTGNSFDTENTTDESLPPQCTKIAGMLASFAEEGHEECQEEPETLAPVKTGVEICQDDAAFGKERDESAGVLIEASWSVDIDVDQGEGGGGDGDSDEESAGSVTSWYFGDRLGEDSGDESGSEAGDEKKED